MTEGSDPIGIAQRTAALQTTTHRLQFRLSACDRLTFIHRRIDEYMRRRHDKVFGTEWQSMSAGSKCDVKRVVALPA